MNNFQDKLYNTILLGMAIQRDPSFVFRVFHEIKRISKTSDKFIEFPDVISNSDISKTENYIAVLNLNPRVIDYHQYALLSIDQVSLYLKTVMQWVIFPYSCVMLSLIRGFLPKLFSPNPLATYLVSLTETELVKIKNENKLNQKTFDRRLEMLRDLKRAMEDLWGLKFKEIKIRIGPVAARDFLVSMSGYDNMIVINPMSVFSYYWPLVALYKMAKLLLHQHYPQMHERFKEQLGLLTVLALTGKSIHAPGMYYTELSRHPVDHAQYQIELISRDLKQYNDFNHKLLHFFPPQNLENNYSLDVISALAIFLIDDEVIDERDLFARISASNAGYKSFSDSYFLFQKAIARLESLGILKKIEKSNELVLLAPLEKHNGVPGTNE
ncbi:MAG: hypothetical protein ACTSRA_14045 [Promethearchaeota archaeon]